MALRGGACRRCIFGGVRLVKHDEHGRDLARRRFDPGHRQAFQEPGETFARGFVERDRHSMTSIVTRIFFGCAAYRTLATQIASTAAPLGAAKDILIFRRFVECHLDGDVLRLDVHYLSSFPTARIMPRFRQLLDERRRPAFCNAAEDAQFVAGRAIR
jgi:hypothetical protein